MADRYKSRRKKSKVECLNSPSYALMQFLLTYKEKKRQWKVLISGGCIDKPAEIIQAIL